MPLYHAVVLTKVTNSKSSAGNERMVSRMLYITNQAADSINVYTVSEGTLSTALGYNITNIKGGLCLIAKPLFSDQEKPDTLKIVFNDYNRSVTVNKTDLYQLYPAYYTWLKQQGQIKHSVSAILTLLQENIGDHPIAEALMVQMFQPEVQMDKRIKQAKLVTRRSQSDEVTDTWNCTYQYNKAGKLTLVKASSGKDVRFSKKVTYLGSNLSLIKCYKNIEDRQITNSAVRYQTGKKTLYQTDIVEETGKNLETTLVSTLTKRDIGKYKRINASQADILNLVK